MKEKNERKLSNKGFSLVELIVALGVMAILVGIAAFSIAYVNNANVSNAANKLEAAIITARTTSMAKGPEAGRLTIYMDDGVLSYTIGDSTDKEEICKSLISVYYRTNCPNLTAASGYDEVPDGYKEVIYFNSAGMIKDNMILTDHCATSGGATISGGLDDHNNAYMFEKGERKIAVIIYPETGKIDTSLYY